MSRHLKLSSSPDSIALASVVSLFSIPNLNVSVLPGDAAAELVDGSNTITGVAAIAQQLASDNDHSLKDERLVATVVAAIGGNRTEMERVATSVLGGSTLFHSVEVNRILRPSVVDALAWSVLHPLALSDPTAVSHHVLRWIAHLQAVRLTSTPAEVLALLPVVAVSLEYVPPAKPASSGAATSNAQQGGRRAPAKKAPASDAAKAKLLVGKIVSIERHPNADSLYVERIDVGEATPRTVVSGLVNWYTSEQLLNRLVVVVANLAPAKLKDIDSYGLVLCASNADKSLVEVIDPPAGTNVGERVRIEGEEFAEEDEEFNKKTFQRFLKFLQTNDNRVACWKEKPLLTSAGIVTVPTLAKADIK